MDNQHRKISGYRELSQEEIDLINEIKQKGLELGELLDKVSNHLDVQLYAADHSNFQRIEEAEPLKWIGLAKTNYQTATMFLVRAVAQPTDGM